MKTFESGTRVEGGYYWNTGRWQVAAVPGDAGVLEGAPGERHVRMPLPLLFVAAPAMGALLVMFLPFVGFALALKAAAGAAAKAARELAADLAALVSPGWRPGETHLQGARPRGETPTAPADDDGLAALAAEIAAKRAQANG